MADLPVRLIILVVVVLFASICLLVIKPVSAGGKLSLKLCLANACAWLVVLPLSDRGHPPPIVLGVALFWLINLPVLPAAATALWLSLKKQGETVAYVYIASTYVVLNLIVLFAIPIIWLVREASRH